MTRWYSGDFNDVSRGHEPDYRVADPTEEGPSRMRGSFRACVRSFQVVHDLYQSGELILHHKLFPCSARHVSYNIHIQHIETSAGPIPSARHVETKGSGGGDRVGGINCGSHLSRGPALVAIATRTNRMWCVAAVASGTEIRIHFKQRIFLCCWCFAKLIHLYRILLFCWNIRADKCNFSIIISLLTKDNNFNVIVLIIKKWYNIWWRGLSSMHIILSVCC